MLVVCIWYYVCGALISFRLVFFILFFFNDTATTEIYTYCHTLSLHDALPIFQQVCGFLDIHHQILSRRSVGACEADRRYCRSEEHTSELQSLMRISYAVFCLKKKKTNTTNTKRNI